MARILAFDASRACSKCGCPNASTKYCMGTGSSNRVTTCEIEGEHLHRVCAKCGYEWLENTLEDTSDELREADK